MMRWIRWSVCCILFVYWSGGIVSCTGSIQPGRDGTITFLEPDPKSEQLVILEGQGQRETPVDTQKQERISEPLDEPASKEPSQAENGGTEQPVEDEPAQEPVTSVDAGEPTPDLMQPEPTPEIPPELRDFIGKPCQVDGVSGTCLLSTSCTGDRVATPGHCPGPSSVQCCTKKTTPSGSCDETKKVTPNTGLTEAAGSGGGPSGMGRGSNFCIDQYEASLVEVLFNGTTRQWSPYFNPGTTPVKAVSVKGAVPQGYINGKQAAAACKLAGKRLCTDTEWLRACRGTQNHTYPYGNTRQPGVCNDARSKHPAVEYYGTSASWVFSKLGNPCINQLANSLGKTGAKTGCVTAEKVYDMMGNLHEWTSTSSGIFRGGYYVDTYRNGNGCLYRTTAHNTSHWDYSTGFRCCADVP